MLTKIATPKKTLRRIEGFVHRRVAGEFLNPDTCRGRRDGKKAPDAWSASLQAIEAEETKYKEDAHSLIKQTQADTQARLTHIDDLLRQNNNTQDKLKTECVLLPEHVAKAQYSSALFHIFIIWFLTIIDTAGVMYIAKKVFSGNILLFSSIGILMTSAVIFGVKTLLEHLAPEKRNLAGKLIMGTGVALIVAGLVGFAVLRTVTFDAALSGNSLVNLEKISLGNLLFTLGLGLGVPLILGVVYEQEALKKKPAKISCDLYKDEKVLMNARMEWTALFKRLQEVDDKIEDITVNHIKLRQNRYVRGYVKGVQKNPEAKRYIDSILKRSQPAAPESSFALKTIGTGRN